MQLAVADPGFPVGGDAKPLGGANLRRGHFLAKMYAKTKELYPVGGAGRRRPLDPPMIRAKYCEFPLFRLQKQSRP